MLNVLLDSVRHMGQRALACAATGLAAQVLHGGRTVHTTFGVSAKEPPHETMACCLQRQTAQGKWIALHDLLVIDEAGSMNRFVLEAVDRACKVRMQFEYFLCRI